VRDEPALLKFFWSVATRYDRLVTFNGRGFDGPQIAVRSAILGVMVERDLVPYRYDLSRHCDLADVLKGQYNGRRCRPTLARGQSHRGRAVRQTGRPTHTRAVRDPARDAVAQALQGRGIMIEFQDVYDKAEWGAGPWQNEPDKVQWIEHDLDCLAVRNPRMGHWCGYVGVAEGHPLFGMHYYGMDENGDSDYERSPASLVRVHGGLTFSDFCHEPTEEEWLQVEHRLNDERLRKQAVLYPKGDSAQTLKELSEQAGLTLTEWVEYQQNRRICHVPEPGRPDRVWWLGFDCAHSGDMSPGLRYEGRSIAWPTDLRSRGNRVGETYRTLDYVKGECRSLARQLKEIADDPAKGEYVERQ
jgi:hypothetical protein